MNNISVQAIDLCRKFGEFMAVDHINFEVRRGEIFGFLGANGAGKTTAIRMLCGLLLPTAGEAYIAGYDVYKDSERIKENIGYMSQKFSLYEDLTVRENIQFYGGIYGLTRKKIAQKTDDLLHYLNLWEQADQLTSALPLGWKQRMALSVALLHDPQIVFLDEPTSGVDPVSRRNFWKLIYQMAEEGKTVFVTTHYMDEAEYCDRVSIMREGKIVELDTPKGLKSHYNAKNMQDVFLEVVNGGSK